MKLEISKTMDEGAVYKELKLIESRDGILMPEFEKLRHGFSARTRIG